MTGTLCFDQSHTHTHGARRRNRIMSVRVAGDVAEVANVAAPVSGTFRVPALLPGLRRFVYRVWTGVNR